ncbi:hypothetical protein H8B02_04245 [Bradyrhizobium sp. Pear77]|uniref:PC4/YdbC family ssDNA-binding protein n=1 Tax=Bradyrhizobium altum TaxID=1571202 RepID=UPI001E2B733F|nr:PC4/YdbC family ssDNA-binding protein [Bradyrhizobium altum]MCC8952704.1 hypothetical protein [Bradyrhizobium altum]
MKRTFKDKFEGLNGRIVDTWKRKNGDRVLLSIQRYHGKKGADLRIWCRTEKDFHPSKRGLRIYCNELQSLFAAVARLRELADDDEF